MQGGSDDFLEHRRRDSRSISGFPRSAVCGHHHYDLWIRYRREPHEAGVVGVRVGVRRGVVDLRRAGLAPRSVFHQPRILPRAPEDHVLHHPAHGDRRLRPQHCDRLALRGIQCQTRLHVKSVVRQDAADLRELERRDHDFVPHGDESNRRFLPFLQRVHHSRRLAGQRNARPLSQLKVLCHVVVQLGWADRHADSNRADIAGMHQHIFKRQCTITMIFVNREPCDLDRAQAAVDHGFRPQPCGLQRCRKRDYLEDRSRLEGDHGCVILTRRHVLAALHRNIRIEGRITGQRQDVAGLRIEDDDAPALAVVFQNGFRQLAFRDALDAGIDR